MADKVYESMFIFNANAYARNPTGAGNSIKEIVDSVGGELLASRMWNEQKLAYPINGQRKGVYWLSYVKFDGDALPKFNRACQLNDIIIRHLVISIDPRLVDTLVAAANETKPPTTSRGDLDDKPSDSMDAESEGTDDSDADSGSETTENSEDTEAMSAE